VRYGRSRSSKIVYFGTNRKRVYNFLLVINSNLGPFLPRSRDIAGFLLRTATPPLFHPKSGVVSIELDCRCWGTEERRPYRLNTRVITFELTRLIWPRYLNDTDGRTDGQRDMEHCAVKMISKRKIPLAHCAAYNSLPKVLAAVDYRIYNVCIAYYVDGDFNYCKSIMCIVCQYKHKHLSGD